MPLDFRLIYGLFYMSLHHSDVSLVTSKNIYPYFISSYQAQGQGIFILITVHQGQGQAVAVMRPYRFTFCTYFILPHSFMMARQLQICILCISILCLISTAAVILHKWWLKCRQTCHFIASYIIHYFISHEPLLASTIELSVTKRTLFSLVQISHTYSFPTQMWITECVSLTTTTGYSFWFIIHLFIKMWAKRNSFSHLVLPILFRQCARCRINQPQTQSVICPDLSKYLLTYTTRWVLDNI